jgi:hypothetical protein
MPILLSMDWRMKTFRAKNRINFAPVEIVPRFGRKDIAKAIHELAEQEGYVDSILHRLTAGAFLNVGIGSPHCPLKKTPNLFNSDCAMCMACALWSGLDRLVFGATIADAGPVRFTD